MRLMDRTDLAIAPARDAEARACRMLLPAAYTGPEPEVLLARGGDGTILGAAALRWQSWTAPPGFPLLVQVVPAVRRRGVGRALVEAAATLARGEAPGLWSWDMLDEGSDPPASSPPAASCRTPASATTGRRWRPSPA